MKRPTQRGSGMLLAIIVVLVVTVIAVGVLRFASRELAGANAGRQREALVACAESGRRLLLTAFRELGVSPTEIAPINEGLDDRDPTKANTKVVGGHVGAANVDQISILPDSPFDVESTGDITNISFPNLAVPGGRGYRVMVHCVDHGRELEIEFAVRFGL